MENLLKVHYIFFSFVSFQRILIYILCRKLKTFKSYTIDSHSLQNGQGLTFHKILPPTDYQIIKWLEIRLVFYRFLFYQNLFLAVVLIAKHKTEITFLLFFLFYFHFSIFAFFIDSCSVCKLRSKGIPKLNIEIRRNVKLFLKHSV